ncbi:hypothetical protein DYB25_010046 [Aphanomyces astaci]|uniref:Helicase ATP-binding domain-containing protein n=1 Tax=Aphanomyces astaci TaxID=112090 RepID=A0A397C7H2_APHAT|nr:hypothetical protein DYB25_010046 [Aphanomyces astaci]
MIMGYTVEFPDGKKPFAAQFAVMNKVLLALKKEQNALLESPTGSGKTLALLCSSLAWQHQHATEVADRNRANVDAFVASKLREAQAKAARDEQVARLSAEQRLASHALGDPIRSVNVTSSTGGASQPLRPPNLDLLDQSQLLQDTDRLNSELMMVPAFYSAVDRPQKEFELACMILRADMLRGGNANRITLQFQGWPPKTYMLDDSTGHIQPVVVEPTTSPCTDQPSPSPLVKAEDKGHDDNEDDDDLMPMSFSQLEKQPKPSLFCPYNYIIDPQIRSSCSITLKNAVVIFDEAHNIEDVCRDAASFELHQASLEDSAKILTTALQNPNVSDSKKHDLKPLLKLINGWNRWLTNVKPTLKPMG